MWWIHKIRITKGPTPIGGTLIEALFGMLAVVVKAWAKVNQTLTLLEACGS